jgi:hypothetical protein
MKRYLIIFFILILLIFLGYYIYKASTFNVFDVEIIKVAEIEVPNKSYKIGLYYLPSNASSQSYIQVKSLGNQEVLQNFERYNFLNDYKLLNDTLRLVLSDTSFIERKADTVFFRLP